MKDEPEVGALRWRVTLCNEQQTASFDGPGITIEYTDRLGVWADIVPVGTAAWLNGKQTEQNLITHKMYIRWRDDLDMFKLVLRERTRPDGTIRREVFRVHRYSDWRGRQRFLLLEAELRGHEAV